VYGSVNAKSRLDDTVFPPEMDWFPPEMTWFPPEMVKSEPEVVFAGESLPFPLSFAVFPLPVQTISVSGSGNVSNNNHSLLCRTRSADAASSSNEVSEAALTRSLPRI
jgi:hypothetical protein